MNNCKWEAKVTQSHNINRKPAYKQWKMNSLMEALANTINDNGNAVTQITIIIEF